MDQVIRILHLEDNAADIELVQSTLESAGMACQISPVESCDEFTEALRKGGYDLILADYTLPAYDGLSALRLAQELCPDIPFIFVSGTMGEDAAIEGLTQGATDYVLKQNLSRLAPAVKRALHEAENQRERKRAEEALQESEARFRMILEGIPDLVLIHDDEGTILYVNAIGAAQLEWSAKDLIGKNLRQIVSPEQAVLIADHIRETHKTGWCRFETTYIARSGWKIIAEVSDRPIKFGKDKAILRVSRDITERKKMEEDLRQSEERFRQFFEKEPEYCYMISLDGDILDINNSALNVLGYKKEEIIGKPLQTIYAPESLPKMKQLFTKWKKTGQLKDEEMVINTKKGDRRIVLLSAAVLKDAEGKALQSISVQKDITERKRAEEELMDAHNQLERLLMFNDALLSAIPTPVFYKDKEGRYLGCNQAFSEFIGVSSDQIKGKTVMELWPSENAEVYHQKDLELIQNPEQQIYEFRVRDKNDIDRPVIFAKNVFRDENKQVAGIVGAFMDITERKQTEEALRQSYHQLSETFYSVVNALISTVEKRDPYTAGHQRRTTILACAIAEEMGLPEERIEGIRMAGAIHDIGKIEVPIEILSRPGSLTDVQYEMVKIHPRTGHDILKGIKFPWPVAEIVFQHHERMNGSGYPQGIKGEKIMMEARILAVADVIEAMSHYRPFRPSLGIDKALEEISQNRGVLFDPDVVDACIRLFTEKEFKFE